MPYSIFRYPLFVALLLITTFANTATAQRSCPAPLQGNAYDRQINRGTINQALFNEAVLYYTNKIRCGRGLPLFQPTRDVFNAATTQAKNMARTRIYDHNLPVPGARTLRDRLRAQTRDFRAAGENIAKNFVYILNGRPYIPAANCAFRYLDTRQPVPIHTYRSLAAELVTSWEASRPHLANILNRRFTRMGAGLGIDRRGQLCGEIYVSQVFAG
ncbi:MAG: CAP domain-containing protein [Rhodobacteraceae bacterium]|nr:CAP domain-containing protein [Paracoccaceae bacterium]